MKLGRLLNSVAALLVLLVGWTWAAPAFQPAESRSGSITRYVLTEPPGARVIAAEAYHDWDRFHQAQRQYEGDVKAGRHPRPPNVPGKQLEPLGITSDSAPLVLDRQRASFCGLALRAPYKPTLIS